MKNLDQMIGEIRSKFKTKCLDPNDSLISIRLFSPTKDQNLSPSELSVLNDPIRRFLKENGVPFKLKNRRMAGGLYVEVIDSIALTVEEAARILDQQATHEKVSNLRRTLIELDVDSTNHRAAMRGLLELDDETITTLLAVATWIKEDDFHDVYRRQVPVAGADTKFIERHEALLATILGHPVELKDHRSQGALIFYRDPVYVETSKHLCDYIIPGYSDTPFAYEPNVILVCENKHSAMLAPLRHRLITVFGAGKNVTPTLAGIPRITEHDDLLYWGDIDEAGFGILTHLRRSGVNITSIAMDLDTVRLHRHLDVPAPRDASAGVDITALTDKERLAFSMIETGEIHRIEQERLPESWVNERIALALDQK